MRYLVIGVWILPFVMDILHCLFELYVVRMRPEPGGLRLYVDVGHQILLGTHP